MSKPCENCDGHADANGTAWCPVCHPPTPQVPNHTGKWILPPSLPSISRIVPIWSTWGTLELGSREPIDGDGGWLWTPADGDSEAFADLIVVAWFDLPEFVP